MNIFYIILLIYYFEGFIKNISFLEIFWSQDSCYINSHITITNNGYIFNIAKIYVIVYILWMGIIPRYNIFSSSDVIQILTFYIQHFILFRTVCIDYRWKYLLQTLTSYVFSDKNISMKIEILVFCNLLKFICYIFYWLMIRCYTISY